MDIRKDTKTKWQYCYLASNGSYFWTLERILKQYYWDYRLIGFTLEKGILTNYTLSSPDFSVFPEVDHYLFNGLRYWDHKLYFKGYVVSANSSLCENFITILDHLKTQAFESIVYDDSFLPEDSQLTHSIDFDIDDHGKIWVLSTYPSAETASRLKIHSYDLESWKINSTIKLQSHWFPKGKYSEQLQALREKWGCVRGVTDFQAAGISIESNLRKIIFSLETDVFSEGGWRWTFAGLRINIYC